LNGGTLTFLLQDHLVHNFHGKQVVLCAPRVATQLHFPERLLARARVRASA